MAPDVTIEARGLTKRYGALTVVDGIDFRVRAGECVGMFLPSWAATAALALPPTHVSFLVRAACLGQPLPTWGWSLAYLVVLTAVGAVLAVALMRRRLIK